MATKGKRRVGGATYICSDPISETPCPRCGKLEVDLPYYGAPNCYSCGWDAGEGPEEWRT